MCVFLVADAAEGVPGRTDSQRAPFLGGWSHPDDRLKSLPEVKVHAVLIVREHRFHYPLERAAITSIAEKTDPVS